METILAGLDHYDVLGVRRDASAEEIKKAYRGLAAKTHPDTAGPAMTSLFLAVQQAWENLGTPEKRAAYDREDQKPESVHEEPSQAEPDETGEGAPADQKAPLGAQPEKPAQTLKESSPFPLLSLLGLSGFLLWAGLTLSLLMLGEKHVPSVGDEFVPSTVTLYALVWIIALGLWINKVRKGGSSPLAPLVIALAGVLVILVDYRNLWIPMAGYLALGNITALILVSLFSRQQAVKRLGLGGGAKNTMSSFTDDALDAAVARARRATSAQMEAVYSLPGARILVNAPAKGGSYGHLIVNGNRVALVDSQWAGHWPGLTLTGDLAQDFGSVSADLQTTLHSDIAQLRRKAPELRCWLVLHPMTVGSVELQPSESIQITAAAGSEAVIQIREWLDGGNNAGRVNLSLMLRLLRSGGRFFH